VPVKTFGGKKLRETLNNIKKTREKSLAVGFFPESKYDDGMPVAQVAFWNEFGTKTIPERPFFRHANNVSSHKVSNIFKSETIYNSKNVISLSKVNKVGEMWVNEIQDSIMGKGISYVPNAPSTVAKKGHDKPLIDTELMLISPKYKVIKS